ncbi:DUF3502 domain-containing protein [Thomasclavelia sp.]
MRKLLLLAISLVLVLQVTGCTKKNEVDTNTVVWRIAAVGNSEDMTNEMVEVWEKPLNELLKEKNAPYQVKIIPFSNKEENKQIQDLKELQKNGEQTDVITILPESQGNELTSWNNTYKLAVENKLLLNLDKWKEKNQKILEKVLVPYDFELSRIDNKLYGISSNVPMISGVMYQKELLDKNGIDSKDIKNNVFENSNLLTQVKDQINIPPLNNINLDPGLWIVSPANNLVWTKENDFISLSKSREYKDLLYQCITLRQQGLLELEPVEESAVSFAASFERDISTRAKFKSLSASQKEFIVIPNESKPNMNLYWGDNKSGIASWSENNKNAEDFLLKLFTDKDIANLIQYGVEGNDYLLDENNHVKVITDKLGLKIFGYQYTNPKITYSLIYEEDDKIEYSNWFYSKYGEDFPKGFRFDAMPVIEEINAVNKIWNTYFDEQTETGLTNKLYTLDIKDLDNFLKELNETLDKAGMQEIVDEANNQYKQWLKEVK